MKKAILVITALAAAEILLLFNNSCAHAWNDFGHMTVAYVAYTHLTPKTKSRVDSLLKLNPYYPTWKSIIAQNGHAVDENVQVFMLAATWPDAIKKDASYVSDGSSEGNRPEGAIARNNSGYSDHNLHKYWHFYDMPFSVSRTKLPSIPNPNALSQITAFRKVLSSNASDELKSYDLSWLLHMVGDVHQPLHCTTRVSEAAPLGDNGGNDVYVKHKGKKMRLHWFWDSCLGLSGDPLAAVQFAKTLTPSAAKAASNITTKSWIKESFQLAQNNVYVSPILPGNGPFDVSEDYALNTIDLSKKQVELAGERLAKILNQELR